MGLFKEACSFLRDDFEAFSDQLCRIGRRLRAEFYNLLDRSSFNTPRPSPVSLDNSSFFPQSGRFRMPSDVLAFFSTERGKRGEQPPEGESSWMQVKNIMLKFIESKKLRSVMAKNWKPLITSIQKEGATPQAYQQAALMLNMLTPRVVRAIAAQDGWADLGKIAARAGREQFAYFYGRPNKDGCGKGFEVTAKILCGLATVRKDKDRIGEFLKVMTSYSGEPEILEAFCEKVGLAVSRQSGRFPFSNYNIFRLGRLKTLQIEYPSIERLPADMIEEKTAIDPITNETVTRKIARGDSGQVLTDEVYKVWDRRSPEGVFINGHQASMKVLLLANRGRFDQQALQSRKEKREKAIGEVMLEAFSKLEFKEEKADPGKNKALEGRLVQRHQEALDYLKNLITEYKSHCASIKFGEVIGHVFNPGALVASDAGGRFLGNFLRNIDKLEGPIQEVVKQLSDPLVRLSKSEIGFYTQVLVSYEALHRPINKQDVYGALRKDLELYRKVYAADNLRINAAMSQLFGLEEEFGGSGETTIARVGEVCQKLHFLYDFRVDRGRALFSRHAQSINNLTLDLRNLFLDSQSGQPLPDCQRGSVPLKRLRETAAGQARGRKPKASESQYVVSRDDYSALMTFILRYEACGRDSELFLRAMPVEDCEKLLDRFLVAARKVHACDGRSARPVPVVNDLIAVEDFLAGKALSREEFTKRMLATQDRGEGRAHCNALAAGLVIPGKHVLDLYNACVALSPASDLRDEIEFARRLIGHKLIDQFFEYQGQSDSGRLAYYSLEWLSEHIDRPYFGPGTASYLKALYAFKDQFDRSRLDREEDIRSRSEAVSRQITAQRVVASLRDTKQLVVGFAPGDSLELPQVEFKTLDPRPVGVLRYTDENALSAEIMRWNERMLWVNELEPQWVRKLAYLVSPDGAKAIEGLGIKAANSQTMQNIRKLWKDRSILLNCAIAREFVMEIDGLEIAVPADFDVAKGFEQAVAMRNIGPNDLLYWKDGVPGSAPMVNFDRVAGQELLMVACNQPGKIWHWYAKYDFRLPEDRCMHIKKIMWYLDKFHLRRTGQHSARVERVPEFIKWLGEGGWSRVNYDAETGRFSFPG